MSMQANKSRAYSFRIRTLFIGLGTLLLISYFIISPIDLLMKYIIITSMITLFSMLYAMVYAKTVYQRHRKDESAFDEFSFGHILIPMLITLIIYQVLIISSISTDPTTLLTYTLVFIFLILFGWEMIERGILRIKKYRNSNMNERLRNSLMDVVLGVIGAIIAAFLIYTTWI